MPEVPCCGTCGTTHHLMVNYRGELACCRCATLQRKWTPLACFDWSGKIGELKPFRERALLTW